MTGIYSKQMKIVLNLCHADDLPFILKLPCSDVLVQTNAFSRSGGIENHQIKNCLDHLKSAGKKSIITWDCLAKDVEIEEASLYLASFLNDCDAVRFLDPGIGMYLKSEFPTLNLELSLEHGSLNTIAIKGWVQQFMPQLSKVVLSNQLPLSIIEMIRYEIPVSVEILGYGQVEMFYSRRSLIGTTSQLESQPPGRHLTISSEDRSSRKNPIVPTTKGTIAYYDKTLNILSFMDEIAAAGIDYLRIEYINSNEFHKFEEIRNICDWQSTLATLEGVHTTRAFLQRNLSHKLFTKLTNKHLVEKFDQKAGSVIESIKNRYCLIRIEKSFSLPQTVQFVSPEGNNAEIRLTELRDLKGISYTNTVEPGVYQTAWYKYVVTGSILIIKDNKSTQKEI